MCGGGEGSLGGLWDGWIWENNITFFAVLYFYVQDSHILYIILISRALYVLIEKYGIATNLGMK